MKTAKELCDLAKEQLAYQQSDRYIMNTYWNNAIDAISTRTLERVPYIVVRIEACCGE